MPYRQLNIDILYHIQNSSSILEWVLGATLDGAELSAGDKVDQIDADVFLRRFCPSYFHGEFILFPALVVHKFGPIVPMWCK